MVVAILPGQGNERVAGEGGDRKESRATSLVVSKKLGFYAELLS